MGFRGCYYDLYLVKQSLNVYKILIEGEASGDAGLLDMEDIRQEPKRKERLR